MEKYLGGEDVTEAEVKRAHPRRHAGVRLRADPVRLGVQEQGRPADARRCHRLPAQPARHPADAGHQAEPRGRDPRPQAVEDEPFAALAFKIVADPFGKLTYFRVYSGQINKGDEVYNSTKERRERLGRILLMHANQREDLDVAMAGDIVAGLGLQGHHHGRHAVRSQQPDHPRADDLPRARHPRGHRAEDQGRPGQARQGPEVAQSDEDPTFRVRTDEETGQTVISGMGELHLEILVDRMQREFGVVATVGKPQVAYRETITKIVESVEYRHIKQSGGSGQFAVVKITLEPNPGKGYEFVDKISGGKIPREYIHPTNQGMQQALDSGVLAGYPTVDVKATLVDGQYHDVDSWRWRSRSPVRWRSRRLPRWPSRFCSSRSWRVEVVTPEDYMGDVMGDLSSAAAAASRAWKPGQHPGHPGPGAAVGDVRLLHRPALAYAGPGHVHHAVRAVHGSAAEHRQRHHQARPRRVSRCDPRLAAGKPYLA